MTTNGESMRCSRSQVGLLFVILFAGAAALPTVARADATTAKAKQLYEDGVTSYNLGHFDEALDAFEKAYRIRHDAAFLFNIGQCQRNLKRYEEAQRTFRAYLRESPDLAEKTRSQIQQIMGEMDRALAEERAKQPPTGTQAPATTQPTESAARTSAPRTAAAPVGASQQTADGSIKQTADESVKTTATERPRPVYKRWWFWTIAGVVVVGGAVTAAVVATTPNNAKAPAGALTISFP
jgi:tetratricopeptide (TPR) repeat protein